MTTLYTVYLLASTQVSESSTDTVVLRESLVEGEERSSKESLLPLEPGLAIFSVEPWILILSFDFVRFFDGRSPSLFTLSTINRQTCGRGHQNFVVGVVWEISWGVSGITCGR